VNLKSPQGVKIVKELASKSDILVENYLPGKLDSFGLGYSHLSKVNPKLIYASITGYGDSGPYAHKPGYDVIIEAEAGLMHITGERDGNPVKVGVAVTGNLQLGLTLRPDYRAAHQSCNFSSAISETKDRPGPEN